MSDKGGRRKQSVVGSRQGTSRKKGTSRSDMSVYISSTEETVRKKESSVYKSSEEYFEYSCDPCKSADEHVEAQGYCTNCKEYLCDTCFRSHSRSTASKHHTLLDKDAMPRMTVKYCDPCKSAGDKIEAAGYCKDCNELLCGICYKSHSRTKSSRHHVLVDKAKLSEESESAVTSPMAKMNIHKKTASNMRYNEYTYIQEINVKADADEKDCKITDMTLLSNTELVLCDPVNNSLKVIDIDNSIIKGVLELQAKPDGITAISKDQVAVVLYNKYRIQIISVSEGLSVGRSIKTTVGRSIKTPVGRSIKTPVDRSIKTPVDRTIKTTGDCVDVKFNNGKLYVSFMEPVQFQILELSSGAIIKTIKPHFEVLKHCTLPRHIAVSPDESMIYVSDWKSNKVLSMDMDGNMVSWYQGELEKPHDITVSPFGSVFLCNGGQHVVYKMTSDLSEATMKLEQGDGLANPQAMCFNTDKQHLYISSGSYHDKYRNFIKVYKWK